MTTQITALVTGASTGIGKATAISLAKNGFKLILLARRENHLKELQSIIGAEHAYIIACDINDHPKLDQALKTLPQAFSQVDLLVNNAGLALGVAPAQEADWLDWQTMIHTNCLSLAYLTHKLLPSMVKNRFGHVINVSSVAGSYAYKGSNAYGASKAFVDQFSQNLRSDLLGTAVRVTNVVPGLLHDSEFSLVRYKGNQQAADKVYEDLEPLKPEDIAETILWVIKQPPHVNINAIEVMPVHQALAGPTTITSLKAPS